MAISVVTGEIIRSGTYASSTWTDPFLNALKTAYPWTSVPSVNYATGSNIYRFTDDCYIDIYCSNCNSSNGTMQIKVTLGSVTKQIREMSIDAGNNKRMSWTIAQTAKGLALSVAYSTITDGITEPDYILFIGHAKTLDGTVKMGCVYTTSRQSSTYNCFIKDNATQGAAQNVGSYDNTANDVATLYPVVNRATGDTFEDIFTINSSPIANCNAMVNNNKYVFGYRIALLDE